MAVPPSAEVTRSLTWPESTRFPSPRSSGTMSTWLVRRAEGEGRAGLSATGRCMAAGIDLSIEATLRP